MSALNCRVGGEGRTIKNDIYATGELVINNILPFNAANPINIDGVIIEDGVITSPANGQQNTASSEGGDVSIVLAKNGVDLPFRSLTNGNLIDLAQDANNVSVAMTNATATADNSFLGIDAGAAIDGGVRNTFIGANAGEANIVDNDNTFIGYNSGDQSTGSSNTFIGSLTGRTVTDSNNVFVGYQAGEAGAGCQNNVTIGSFAGESIAEADNNTLVGYLSGFSNDVANRTMIGSQTGNVNSGDSSVVIGYKAGVNSVTANRLLIDNATTATPFIDGTFVPNILTFNSNVNIGRSAATDLPQFTQVFAVGVDTAQYLRIKINDIPYKIKLYLPFV